LIKEGNAPDEIVKAAEAEEVDLIVIATHGWTGWRRFIFGSVAEKLVRLSTLPVLTIPEP
jgi:nucleotide-binding universal stress UspA family protein